MGQHTRLVAKMLLGTTVLASVGTGGYYAATGGLKIPSLTKSLDDPAAGVATTAPAAGGELDAVASAWAQPLPVASQPIADPYGPAPQSTADTAAATLATPPSTDDRYAVYPAGPTSAGIADPASLPGEAERDVPASHNETLPVTTTDDSPSIEASPAAAAVDERNPSSPIARGQEPQDAADASTTTPSINFGVEDAAAAADVAEPQPLNLPSDEQPLRSSTSRAKQAFGDVPVDSGGDRYGGPAASSAANTGAASKSTSTNPFEDGAAVGVPTGNPVGPIEQLPAYPGQAANGRTAAATGADTGRGESPNSRTARAGRMPANNRFNSAASPLPNAASTAAEGGIGPSGTGLSGTNSSEMGSISGTGRPGERTLEGPQNSHLVIQKFAPGEIQVGKPAKFVVQVRNTGNQAAHELVVSDEVPEGTQLVSTSPSAQANGNRLVWQIEKLSAGEERTFEMQLMPMVEGEVGSVATVTYAAQASVKTRCTMPQLAIRMTAPDKVLIGHEQRVKIELRNPGSGDATGVLLFEDVPQNLRHAAGPVLEFEIGTLRAGESRELELVLMAEKAGPVVNTLTARADGNLQAQEAVQFEVIAPALAVEVKGPERRFLERPAKYEVSVQNPGTAPAYDVQIVTKLPKGMRFVKANNMGEYDANSHAVYWSLAELPEGERGTVELVAMPTETGPQTLTVETRGGQGLSDEAQQQVLVEGLAAIQFEVRDLDDPIEVGGETGYEIRVVNQGTKAATNVRVAVNLSNGMQIVSAEGQTQHAAQGNALVFEPLPQLAAKSDALFRVRVRGAEAGDQRVMVEVTTDDLAPIRREESTRVFGDE